MSLALRGIGIPYGHQNNDPIAANRIHDSWIRQKDPLELKINSDYMATLNGIIDDAAGIIRAVECGACLSRDWRMLDEDTVVNELAILSDDLEKTSDLTLKVHSQMGDETKTIPVSEETKKLLELSKKMISYSETVREKMRATGIQTGQQFTDPLAAKRLHQVSNRLGIIVNSDDPSEIEKAMMEISNDARFLIRAVNAGIFVEEEWRALDNCLFPREGKILSRPTIKQELIMYKDDLEFIAQRVLDKKPDATELNDNVHQVDVAVEESSLSEKSKELLELARQLEELSKTTTNVIQH